MTIDTSVGDFIGEASVPEPTEAQVDAAFRKLHELYMLEDPECPHKDFDKWMADDPKEYAKGVTVLRETLRAAFTDEHFMALANEVVRLEQQVATQAAEIERLRNLTEWRP